MTRQPTDWNDYLGRFHARHPGITEDVLARSFHGPLTPYRWLAADIDPAARLLDLGCGSAPARPEGAQRWAGLDRSHDELDRAAALDRGPLVRADMTTLPIADASVDVVTCSMAMMLVQPLDAALREVGRVLRPGGELRLLVPTPGPTPLTVNDAVTYLRLFVAARSTTKFPASPLRKSAAETLERHGYSIASDDRRRFEHPVDHPDDAQRFIDSWYLPTTSESRRMAARHRAQTLAPFRIGIPLRRIIARRP
jgi:SAM-dependent methyltransferase